MKASLLSEFQPDGSPAFRGDSPCVSCDGDGPLHALARLRGLGDGGRGLNEGVPFFCKEGAMVAKRDTWLQACGKCSHEGIGVVARLAGEGPESGKCELAVPSRALSRL